MKKILLADDSETFCTLTKNILESKKNYTVDTALSENQVIDLLHKNPDYDAILLDLWFPNEIAGSRTLAHCQKHHPTIPVIIISGTASPEAAVLSIKNGAYDFIEKPLKIERLLLTLQNAIEKFEITRQFIEYQIKAMHMIGTSPHMQQLFHNITLAAGSECSVLIMGETGTGKELVADAIHRLSNRSANAMISINCSAIPGELMESELFGHTRGSFTGAINTHIGLAEQAHNSTLFLDEISEFPLPLQARVLRFLESGAIQPVGGETRHVNTRIISATNCDLETLMRQNLFREDLYYRIHEFVIQVPALRDHKEDIPQLALHFIDRFCKKQHIPNKEISKEALALLMEQPWPGNVRQFKNSIRRCMLFAQQNNITQQHVQEALMTPSKKVQKTLREALVQFEKEYITKHLVLADWNVTQAAEILGMDRSNLYKKIHILGIELQ